MHFQAQSFIFFVGMRCQGNVSCRSLRLDGMTSFLLLLWLFCRWAPGCEVGDEMSWWKRFLFCFMGLSLNFRSIWWWGGGEGKPSCFCLGKVKMLIILWVEIRGLSSLTFVHFLLHFLLWCWKPTFSLQPMEITHKLIFFHPGSISCSFLCTFQLLSIIYCSCKCSSALRFLLVMDKVVYPQLFSSASSRMGEFLFQVLDLWNLEHFRWIRASKSLYSL